MLQALIFLRDARFIMNEKDLAVACFKQGFN